MKCIFQLYSHGTVTSLDKTVGTVITSKCNCNNSGLQEKAYEGLKHSSSDLMNIKAIVRINDYDDCDLHVMYIILSLH